MIGFYNYTVILTYLSLASATAGILVTMSGNGHPYIGVFLLMFSGLCDAFDGKVASTNKNRCDQEKKFGIQIDSLSDIVAFGVLPACIGSELLEDAPFLTMLSDKFGISTSLIVTGLLYASLIIFVLTGLIRLAYFNVMEEERQAQTTERRKTYRGLPITASSLIFPTIMFAQYIFKIDLTAIYFLFIILTGIAFIAPFSIKKPSLKAIMIMIGIGVIEVLLVMVTIFFNVRM